MFSEEFFFIFNEFIRVVVWPILFVFLNGGFEMVLAISYKGLVQKGRSIKVIYKDGDDQLQEWHTVPSKVADFHKNHPNAKSIVAIDQKATFHLLDYPSIPLNLCFAALLADLVSLFNPEIDKFIWIHRWVLFIHLCTLIVVASMTLKAMKEEDDKKRRNLIFNSICLSLIATSLGFFALRNVL